MQRLAWVIVLVATTAQAQAPERATLADERRRLETAFAAEEARCAERFAVAACVEDVRQRRRAALAPLREREQALDEAERRQRAAERQRTLQGRQEQRAARPASAPDAAQAPLVRVRPASPARPDSAVTGTTRPADRAERAQEAAARAAAAERRREQGLEAQRRIQRREAERAAGGKVARPLPVPASAAAR